MTRLAILGASGHGKVVADAALLAGWSDIVFYDDRWPAYAAVGDWSVTGTRAELIRDCAGHDGVIVAIGDNCVRVARYHELVAAGAPMVTVVHPSAVISARARVGAGTLVGACAVIGPFATAGVACIINTGATVDHDCVLGDGVHVSPGVHLGGATRVGDGTWIGIGAAVRHGLTIGSSVIVGAGAAVVKNVGNDVTVLGVPARPKSIQA